MTEQRSEVILPFSYTRNQIPHTCNNPSLSISNRKKDDASVSMKSINQDLAGGRQMASITGVSPLREVEGPSRPGGASSIHRVLSDGPESAAAVPPVPDFGRRGGEDDGGGGSARKMRLPLRP